MRPITAALAARLHAAVLLASSAIGVTGHYLQHGRVQVTAFIPASVGLLLVFVSAAPAKNDRARRLLLFAIAFAFGIIVTNLAIRFLHQDFQPLRKRLYFPAMALSSMVTCGVLLRTITKRGTPG